ncbi:uncharacterized protein BP5553_09101 [Venustampulla echinocandica]|uniref:Rhodopsin domain-containing protein n=1 Tax=Venustampulla echinocandica TaxID=2656787 RepID=A0A370TDV6_9HELO|nr:uncharacterized protein BP5553_09101 [Venustampulla echinocandica]RDL32645.1 hypothetical protein BP5553_09101 [Venustampulla echinocandica]
MGLQVLRAVSKAATGSKDSHQEAIVVVEVILVALAIIVYSLKLYTRCFILRRVGIDDYIMGVAVALSLGLSIIACIGTKYGWGSHIQDIPFQNFTLLLFLSWLTQVIFNACAALVKISILVFYLQLAEDSIIRGFRIVVFCAIGVITSFFIAYTFVTIFQCNPVQAYWDPFTMKTKCLDPSLGLLLHGILNSVFDFFVFFLPMPIVWKLQIIQRQRFELLGVFAIGFVACILGAIRIHFLMICQQSSDSPWAGYYFWCFQCAEINIGIVCASLPPLKALLKHILHKPAMDATGASDTNDSRRRWAIFQNSKMSSIQLLDQEHARDSAVKG